MLFRSLAAYTADERGRHRVRPGLTGWAQIHGRNDLPWTERLSLDLWYVDHLSAALDLRIAAATLVRLATRRGARSDPSSSMADLDQERQPA